MQTALYVLHASCLSSGEAATGPQFLFAFLAVDPGRRSRMVITSLLWPDLAVEAARAELARVVHALRERLGPVIVGDRGTVRLDFTQDICTDLQLVELDLQRGHHSRRFSAVLARLTVQLSMNGELNEAIVWAYRWTEHASLDEHAQRCVISLLFQSGRPAAAVAHFDDLVARLRRDLEVAPESATAGVMSRPSPEW